MAVVILSAVKYGKMPGTVQFRPDVVYEALKYHNDRLMGGTSHLSFNVSDGGWGSGPTYDRHIGEI